MVPDGVGRRIVLSKEGSNIIARLIEGKSVGDLLKKDGARATPKQEPVAVRVPAAGK